MNRMDIFIRNLKNLMIERGIRNAKQLSEKIGISGASAYSIINGKWKPSLDVIFKIVDYFNVSIGDMFIANDGQIKVKSTYNGNESSLIELLQSQLKNKDYELQELTDEVTELKHELSIRDLAMDNINDTSKLIFNNKGVAISKNGIQIPLFDDAVNIQYISASGKFIVQAEFYVDEIVNEGGIIQ